MQTHNSTNNKKEDTDMNNRTRWITIFLLAGLVISAGLASAGFWDSDAPEVQQKKVITVSGHGTVDIYPDEAVL